jgi:hypothetical protein
VFAGQANAQHGFVWLGVDCDLAVVALVDDPT